MNKKLIMLMAAALALLSARGQVVGFTNYGEYEPVTITLSDNQTSLNKVFVVYDIDGVGMTYTASTDLPVVWKTYNDEPIGGVIHQGRVTKLPQVKANQGYKIVEGYDSITHYYWVVNYAEHYLELNDLFINNEEPCKLLTLRVDGIGDAIRYDEVNGRHMTLDREIKLYYNSLEWDGESKWKPKTMEETFESLDTEFQVEQPLCDTYFLLTGDRFLRAWNKADSVESVTTFTTKAVACASTAQLIDYYGEDSDSDSDSDDGDDGDNDDESDTGIPEEPLSAPVHIIFKGYHSFPSSTGFSRWEMATDQDFEDVVPFPQDEVDYVFNDFGTYYMRYMVTNSENSCPAYGTTYTIIVSESYMPIPAKMPNVLSQGLTKWKVKTKSLIEFHCWIYNRWGKLVYEFTDPDGEWDGTYNGRPLDTGVYYYVITAKGNDGVSYKRRGDINILKYKGNSGSGIGGGGMDNPSGY